MHDKNFVFFMLPAGRGRWERDRSSDERAAAQRERIVVAAAEGALEHWRGLRVAHVVARAGVGRNTFYLHFDDVDGAIAVAEERAVQALLVGLTNATGSARTPVERLRVTAAAWLRVAASEATFVRLVLTAGSPGARARLFEATAKAVAELVRNAKAAGVIGGAPEPGRVRCVAGVFETAARLVAEAPQGDVTGLGDTLVDLVLRAFR